MHQETAGGVPYFDLGGQLDLVLVEYDALGVPAVEDDPLEELGPIAKGPQPADLEYDVTESVAGTFDAEKDRVQFRLQFPIANDQMFDEDVQLITNVALWLMVGYP